MVERIEEPIEVIVLFSDGKLHPLRFRWRNIAHRISSVTSHWVEREGTSRIHHYAVLTDGADCFEIKFRARTMDWELARVYLEGA
jgi:hypothetical protein